MVAFRDDSEEDRYYNTPYGRFMSVTTLIEHGVPKPVLMFWAASETAKAAFDALPRMLRARGEDARKEVLTWLRKASTRKRDTAAELGSAVHAAADAHVLGEPHPEPTEEQAPFIRAFLQFIEDFQPEFVATELLLCNEDAGYAGAADFYAYITLPDVGRVLVVGDYKTGKNVYPEVALQLCAYKHARHAFIPSTGVEVEVPPATHAVVVHIRPDKHKRKGYAVYPVQIDGEVYEKFRHVIGVADFSTRVSKTVVGKRIDPVPAAA